MGFVLGCCLGRPPPARACTNRRNLLSQITMSGESQGLVCCPSKCAHGRSSNGKRNTATTNKYQPPRASVRHQLGLLPVGVTRRKIEDTHPLSSHFHPRRSKTTPQPAPPPTRLNTPHRVSSPALTKPTSECTSHDPIVVVWEVVTSTLAGKLHYRPP
jgi:hypothetical protein